MEPVIKIHRDYLEATPEGHPLHKMLRSLSTAAPADDRMRCPAPVQPIASHDADADHQQTAEDARGKQISQQRRETWLHSMKKLLGQIPLWDREDTKAF